MLRKSAELKSLEYIEKAPIENLSESISSAKINPIHLSKKILHALYRRLDENILEAIKNFEDIMSPTYLSKEKGGPLPHGHQFIKDRIDVNPHLFAAMANKQGLTVDQAIELALERTNEQTTAVKRLLSEHLHDLYAFREMLGVVRIFSDVFKKASRALEISLYPQPLARALKMEQLKLQTEFIPLQIFRANASEGIKLEGTPDLAILQGLHRLNEEALNRLFSEVYALLPPGANILATYSKDYMVAEGFEEVLHSRGFSLTQEGCGTIEIKPPEKDTLLNLGIGEDDINKAVRKLTGESNVLHMNTIGKTAENTIPVLTKIGSEENGRNITPVPKEELDINREAVKNIRAIFTPALNQYPNAPMLVSVEENKRKVAVIGFDMNPNKPRSVEVGVYPGASGLTMDLRKFARELAKRAELRNSLGIVPNNETKISTKALSKIAYP